MSARPSARGVDPTQTPLRPSEATPPSERGRDRRLAAAAAAVLTAAAVVGVGLLVSGNDASSDNQAAVVAAPGPTAPADDEFTGDGTAPPNTEPVSTVAPPPPSTVSTTEPSEAEEGDVEFFACDTRCGVAFSRPTEDGGAVEGYYFENADESPVAPDVLRITVMNQEDRVIYQSDPLTIYGFDRPEPFGVIGGHDGLMIVTFTSGMGSGGGITEAIALRVNGDEVNDFGGAVEAQGDGMTAYMFPFQSSTAVFGVRELTGDETNELLTGWGTFEDQNTAPGFPDYYDVTVHEFTDSAETLGCEKVPVDDFMSWSEGPPYANDCTSAAAG